MKELSIISSELKSPKDKKNSFGGYSYRNAEGILEAVKPLLLKQDCSLVVSTDIRLIGDRYYVFATATITNSKGEQISATAPAREPKEKKGMDEAQVTGASTSYAKKYALCNLFSIDDSSLDPDETNNGEDGSPTTDTQTTQTNKSLSPKADEKAKAASAPILTPDEICKVWLTKETREDANLFYNEYKNQIDITKEPFASTIKQISTKFPKK